MDPIINYYFKEFQEKHLGCSGILIRENMDDFVVRDSVKHLGCYFVCNSIIKFHCADQILLVGPLKGEDEFIPGGNLLAGRVIDLKSPRMGFVGAEEDPVVILGLEGVSINATEVMKIKNVVIYLLEGKAFHLGASGFLHFENVSVRRLKLTGSTLTIMQEFNWKTYEEFRSSSR